MLLLNINKTANQSFSFITNNTNWDIVLKHNPAGFTMATITADGQELCKNEKCFANQPILPNEWQSHKGNLVFKTENENYPVYSDYGTTCFLYFIEPGEVL